MPRGIQNRKPTKLKLLTGTARKDRIPKNEPKPRPVAPECPSWLPKAAKKKWAELAPKLERIGLLTETDGEAFALLCLHWMFAKEAGTKLSKSGLLKKGRKNPLHQIFRDHSTKFESYAAHFGLTPQDRGRIDLPQLDDQDDDFNAPRAGTR